jgi:hypothetical protein
LLLHVVVTGLVPLLDAFIERDRPDSVVHVESEDRPSCPTGHDHLKCQLCRHISTTILAVIAVDRVPHGNVQFHVETAVARTTLASADQVLPVGSRAPPIA